MSTEILSKNLDIKKDRDDQLLFEVSVLAPESLLKSEFLKIT